MLREETTAHMRPSTADLLRVLNKRGMSTPELISVLREIIHTINVCEQKISNNDLMIGLAIDNTAINAHGIFSGRPKMSIDDEDSGRTLLWTKPKGFIETINRK